MAVAAETEPLLDASSFLAGLGPDAERQELIEGRVVMMVGGRRAAFALSARLVIALGNRFAGGPCMAYGDGALVRIDERTLLSPDVFVDCSPFDPTPQWFEAPVVIAAVLSETTEIRDRTVKWRLYRGLASLRHYLLVSQVERRIEHYAKAGEVWRYLDLVGDDDVLRIESLGIEFPLGEIYEGIIASAEEG